MMLLVQVHHHIQFQGKSVEILINAFLTGWSLETNQSASGDT